MENNRKRNIIFIIILALTVIDIVCTYIYVTMFGIFSEGNPVIRFLIQTIGLNEALLLIFTFTMLCLFVLWKFGKRRIFYFATIGIFLIKVLIVLLHLRWIIQLIQ